MKVYKYMYTSIEYLNKNIMEHNIKYKNKIY